MLCDPFSVALFVCFLRGGGGGGVLLGSQKFLFQQAV